MIEFNRRRALTLIAGTAAGAGLLQYAKAAVPQSGTSVRSLGEIALQRGILFGTSIEMDTLAKPEQAALYAHHARIFTVDNSMKFGSLRPVEGPANFDAADRLVAFAAARGIPIRGTNLAWNDWVPPWITKLSPTRAAYWFDRHIDEVVGRYAGKLHSWDVVNEPLFPLHGNPDGYRSGPWYTAMGKNYVIRAMKRARAADPTGKCIINEAGPEWENPWGPVKPYRDGMLRLIKEVQDSGVKLDAVGLECHWFPEFKFDANRFTDYLHTLAATGVSIYLTELDVNDGSMAGSQDERDRLVGQRFAEVITAALKEPKVEAIITWQLADGASWLMGEPTLWGSSKRRPRPLPFDEAYKAKAAYYAIAQSLKI